MRYDRKDFDKSFILQSVMVFAEKSASISVKPYSLRNSSPIGSEKWLRLYLRISQYLYISQTWSIDW